ncbi:MAG: polysaccharide deacetylase family protein [Defluviitaleaceae bacterium]|nr:polysaccharide deacetylase family protein [Defluviitaleaceae bacterium]
MKKIIYVFTIFAIILSVGCSIIEPNNDLNTFQPNRIGSIEPTVTTTVPEETHTPPTAQPSPEPTKPPPTMPPSRGMVALTFDDGPSPYTDKILDLLEQYDGRATFFVVGNRLDSYRDTLIRAVNLGNEIANHSQTHVRLTSLSDNEVVSEIQSASAAIESITGISLPIYRPPFGITDERIVNISTELGYGIVKWTLDPLDWRDRDADIIYYRIMSQVEDGSVILLHDIHQTTAQAMERVIPSLIEQDFQLVTVSELLNHRNGGLEAGSIYGSYCAWKIWD